MRNNWAAYDVEEAKTGLFCVAMPSITVTSTMMQILTRTKRPLAALSESVPTADGVRKVEPALRDLTWHANGVMRTRHDHGAGHPKA